MYYPKKLVFIPPSSSPQHPNQFVGFHFHGINTVLMKQSGLIGISNANVDIDRDLKQKFRFSYKFSQDAENLRARTEEMFGIQQYGTYIHRLFTRERDMKKIIGFCTLLFLGFANVFYMVIRVFTEI
uniref:Uncharacterized protein n=1 Tax=Panagrolaimus sp. JU765 TaxID=591449 RepID=A0AC34RN30_9BILA